MHTDRKRLSINDIRNSINQVKQKLVCTVTPNSKNTLISDDGNCKKYLTFVIYFDRYHNNNIFVSSQL